MCERRKCLAQMLKYTLSSSIFKDVYILFLENRNNLKERWKRFWIKETLADAIKILEVFRIINDRICCFA